MQIVIAGGAGYLGSRLQTELIAKGHQVQILTRRETSGGASGALLSWNPPAVEGAWLEAVAHADAVVNLAGSSLASGRWTRARMAEHRESRLNATTAIVSALRLSGARGGNKVLVNASAVGYYGNRGDETLEESSAPGSGRLAHLCVDWEHAAVAAEDFGVRVVRLRTGVVFGSGGALPRLTLPFRLFVGGPLGSGRQWLSWIHETDEVRLITYALENKKLAGPVNATAPQPAREADVARAIGRALGRPSWLPVPRVMLLVALGRMADAMLFVSQRALPTAAQEAGFRFEYPSLDLALGQILSRGR